MSCVSDNEFYISLIDNCHSRTAGLAGLYGTLSTSLIGISISDPSAGQIKVHWKWTQIDHISAQASNNTVDDNRICIIHTSRSEIYPNYVSTSLNNKLMSHLINWEIICLTTKPACHISKMLIFF